MGKEKNETKSNETKVATEATKQQDSPGLFDRAWNLLKSMKFAVILLLIIAAGSIFNLFANEFIVPTSADAERAAITYERAYGDFRADLFMFLQMYNPYRSWWYSLLLGLLLLSLLVCVIDRTPLVFRQTFRMPGVEDEEQIRRYRANAQIRGSGLAERTKSFLKHRGFLVHSEETDEGVKIGAMRNSWAYFGPWLVHVGFILLVIGGAMIARGAYNTNAGGLPGDFLRPSEAEWGFNVRIDDFHVEYHPLMKGQYVQVDGHKIGEIVAENEGGTFDVQLYVPQRELVQGISADRLANRIDRKMQGGRIDQANIADYIATLTVFENGDSVTTKTIEVNSPLRYNGYRFYQSSYNPEVTDSQGTWTTIINVRKDSGAPLVWLGIILVSLGLVIGLYFDPVRVVALIRQEGEAEVATLGGRSGRNRALFGEQFQEWIDKIEAKTVKAKG